MLTGVTEALNQGSFNLPKSSYGLRGVDLRKDDIITVDAFVHPVTAIKLSKRIHYTSGEPVSCFKRGFERRIEELAQGKWLACGGSQYIQWTQRKPKDDPPAVTVWIIRVSNCLQSLETALAARFAQQGDQFADALLQDIFVFFRDVWIVSFLLVQVCNLRIVMPRFKETNLGQVCKTGVNKTPIISFGLSWQGWYSLQRYCLTLCKMRNVHLGKAFSIR